MVSESSDVSAKKTAKTRSKQTHGLLEKRFVAEWNRPDWIALGASALSGLLLGSGSYSLWLSKSPADHGNFLLLGGFVAGALFLFRLTTNQTVVLVGDAGVATERGGELTRLLWSEIETIRYEDEHLVLAGATTTLQVAAQSHTRAIRAVLAEAAERLPKILDVSSKVVDQLPAVTGEGPAAERVESLQVAGKRCLVTNQLLTFERDARLCPKCTSIYHREHVPAACVTCEQPLGDAAVQIEG